MQGNTDSVQWVTEAVTNAFSQQCLLETNGHELLEESAFDIAPQQQQLPQQPAPSQPGAQSSGLEHRKVQGWKDQWHLLKKREAVAIADVASSVNQGTFKPHELAADEPAHTSAPCTTGGEGHAHGVPQLRRRAWAHVSGVREAVLTVKKQLSAAQPGASYVVGLTSSIQSVDDLLGAFHTWNTAGMQDLAKQAAQLESEMAAAVLALEEDVVSPVPVAAGVGGAVAGGGARPQRAVSAGGAARRGTREPQGAHLCSRRSLPGQAQDSNHHQQHPSAASATQKRPSHGGTSRDGDSRGGPQGSLAPEVVEFDEFVRARGEWGGWEEEDHEAFEAILKACGGDYTHAVKVALERCVGFTRSEVMQHASWHMDYMDLLVRKRMAVAAWRAKRDHVRAQAQARAALLAPEPWLAPAAQASAERSAACEAQAEGMREAAETRDRVAGWRARRDQASREAAERAAQAAREAAQRAEWQREERQHANRLRLEVHKEIKERQAREGARVAARAAEQQQALRALTSNQVEAVAQRSQATFARRQELMELKKQAAARRSTVQQQLLEQVHVEVPADPQRVMKGTAAHMMRLQQTRDEQHKPRDSDFILHVSHRQAPSWRAGLQGL